MNCPKCNHILPEDSLFCQYCGIKIESTETKSSTIKYPSDKATLIEGKESIVPILEQNDKTFFHDESNDYSEKEHKKRNKKVFCRKCGHEIVGRRCEYCHPKKEDSKKNRVIIILAIFLSFFLIGNIIQGVIQYQNHKKILDLTFRTLVQQSSLENAEQQIDDTMEILNDLNDLYSAHNKLPIGYASDVFYSDKGIIALKQEESTSITLHSDTVFFKYTTSGSAAVVNTVNSTSLSDWTITNELKIFAKDKGITKVTLKHPDGLYYCIIIIVI